MSFVHCPEDVLKKEFPIKTRLDKVFDAKVKLKDGTIKIVKTLAAHPQIKNNNIPRFVTKYISNSVCKNFSIKGNRFFIAHSKELFDSMIKLSHENKTIYTKRGCYKKFITTSFQFPIVEKIKAAHLLVCVVVGQFQYVS